MVTSFQFIPAKTKWGVAVVLTFTIEFYQFFNLINTMNVQTDLIPDIQGNAVLDPGAPVPGNMLESKIC